MGHMWQNVGICVSISCIMQPATCSTESPELANLLALHSLPTVLDLQNSFFSVFGRSKVGGCFQACTTAFIGAFYVALRARDGSSLAALARAGCDFNR